MTPDQINIAIARALGWVEVPDKHYFDYREFERGNDRIASIDIPNYHESLDACAECEKTLTNEECEDFISELRKIIIPDVAGFLSHDDAWRLITSSAQQRCRAFLTVKGLWKETP